MLLYLELRKRKADIPEFEKQLRTTLCNLLDSPEDKKRIFEGMMDAQATYLSGYDGHLYPARERQYRVDRKRATKTLVEMIQREKPPDLEKPDWITPRDFDIEALLEALDIDPEIELESGK